MFSKIDLVLKCGFFWPKILKYFHQVKKKENNLISYCTDESKSSRNRTRNITDKTKRWTGMIWLNWCCYKITLPGNRPQEELDRRRFGSRRFVRDWISNDVSTRQPVHLIPNVSREIELDRIEFRRLDRSRKQRKRAGRQNGIDDDDNSNIKGTFHTGICNDWCL